LAFGVAMNNNHTTNQNWAVSGGGLSWSRIAQTAQVNAFNAGNNWRLRGELWTATVGGSPGSMTVTMDAFSAGSQQSWNSLVVIEVDEDDGVVQSITNTAMYSNETEGNQPSLTTTLPGSATDGNLVLAFFGVGGDEEGPFSVPSGFTALANQETLDVSVAAFHRSNFTGTAITSQKLAGLMGGFVGIAVELAAVEEEPAPGLVAKVWNGSSWDTATVKTWDGSSWASL